MESLLAAFGLPERFFGSSQKFDYASVRLTDSFRTVLYVPRLREAFIQHATTTCTKRALFLEGFTYGLHTGDIFRVPPRELRELGYY